MADKVTVENVKSCGEKNRTELNATCLNNHVEILDLESH